MERTTRIRLCSVMHCPFRQLYKWGALYLHWVYITFRLLSRNPVCVGSPSWVHRILLMTASRTNMRLGKGWWHTYLFIYLLLLIYLLNAIISCKNVLFFRLKESRFHTFCCGTSRQLWVSYQADDTEIVECQMEIMCLEFCQSYWIACLVLSKSSWDLWNLVPLKLHWPLA